jgi:sugar phosphate isomerase/epimerase
MKLGVVSAVFVDRPLEAALDEFQRLGLEAVEIPVGGFFPKGHCDPAALLDDPAAVGRLKAAVARRGLEVSALAVHGNPLHPKPEAARAHDRDFRQACQLAAQLGVGRVTLLAGLPAASPAGDVPHWLTWFYPPDLSDAYEWQWQERVIPYWRESARFAQNLGVRLCFEMVPGDAVFNPATLLRLRAAVGPAVGCNFDPSHLFFQGIDPVEAIHVLGDAIYHVHGKDARLDPRKVRVNGVLDPKAYADEQGRGWAYRTIGYGHDRQYWADFMSALRLVGYDDVVSIEHEDSLMSAGEGLGKAVHLLKDVLMREPAGAWWAVK